MAKRLVVSIVCMWSFACFGQRIGSPLAAEELESRELLAQSFSAPMVNHKWAVAEEPIDPWKQWELVENYSFGLNRGSIPMIADLQALHPYFRDKVIELIAACRAKGIELAIVETYRTHTKQNEYRSMGRNYTRSVGGRSKHQYGLAIDVVPMNDSVPQWRNIKLWRKIGPIGERLGLRWGGRWRRPFDPGHFEWSGGLGIADLAHGVFPVVPKPANYPCVADDLSELKSHWKAWESEQSTLARTLRSRRLASKNVASRASLGVGDD